MQANFINFKFTFKVYVYICNKKIKQMKYIITLLMILIINAKIVFASSGYHYARIKDIVNIEGVRDNNLMGYGLVVGLKGTGDNLRNSIFTRKVLIELLQKFGIDTKGDSNLKTKNIAAVAITANLPPFARKGTKIDITVSTLGDAKSLKGGVLLATPIMGADGEVYAVAQGSLDVSGYDVSSDSGSSTNKGEVTTAYIANGANIERELNFNFNQRNKIQLTLKNPDISTANNIVNIINKKMQQNIAKTLDPATISLSIKGKYSNNVMLLLQKIENFKVSTDIPARIVIDKASGTIVLGHNVTISKIAIAQGNLQIVVNETQEESKIKEIYNDYEAIYKDTINNSNIVINESSDKKIMILDPKQANLTSLVNGLNSLGVSPRDLITILRVIKKAGALQAEIITM